MFDQGHVALRRFARRILQQQDGAIMPVFALALVPLVGMVGAALDYTRAQKVQANLQVALDAAVIAGVRDGSANRYTVALNTFNANVKASGATVSAPNFSGANSEVLTATVSASVPTEVMGVLGASAITVTAKSSAAAASKTATPFCVMALNPTASSALQLSGNSNVRITAPQCTVMVNSNAVPAVDTSGTASIQSAENCFVGSTRSVGNSSVSPSPDALCKPRPDPFANKYDKPTPGPCSFTNYSVSGGTVTVQPGVYCGGMSFSGQSTVTFQPGLYIVKDGPLKTTGGTSLTGDGVTFFLTGSGAAINIAGTGDVHFVASNTGPFPGFVFFLDPYGPTGNAASSSSLSGDGELYFEGMVYTPGQQLSVTGNGTANADAPFTAYIADTLKFNGNGSLTINMDLTKTSVRIPDAIRTGTGALLRLTE